jgi:hypothetical protein
MKSRKLLFALITSLSCCLGLLAVYPLVGEEGDKAADPALERTRKQVRMLDTIYKGSIVVVTKQYVSDKTDVPAGTLFKQIFALAKEGGFHEVRLLDATGEPYNDENRPRDEFEKKAIAALKSGKDWYEVEIEKDGQRMLRVATPIPVVMEQCISCHANYADAKKGEAIGALGYIIPIE